MHSRFQQRIADTLVSTKKKSGTKAATEYAKKVHTMLNQSEWDDLSKIVMEMKKSNKP